MPVVLMICVRMSLGTSSPLSIATFLSLIHFAPVVRSNWHACFTSLINAQFFGLYWKGQSYRVQTHEY